MNDKNYYKKKVEELLALKNKKFLAMSEAIQNQNSISQEAIDKAVKEYKEISDFYYDFRDLMES